MKKHTLDDYIESKNPIEDYLFDYFNKEDNLIILDVGSCEGEDSIRYSKLFPSARVFAFEPLPKNIKKINTNLKRFEHPDIQVIPSAVSNETGSAVFHVSSGAPPGKENDEDWNYGNKSSSLYAPNEVSEVFPWLKFEESIEVPVTTINEFSQEQSLTRIDLIHLDVQGAELDVLKGAGEMIKNISMVYMEVESRPLYKGQPLKSEVEEFMIEQGFVLATDTVGEVAGDQLYIRKEIFKEPSREQPSNKRKHRGLVKRLKRSIVKRLSDPEVRPAEEIHVALPNTQVGTQNAEAREAWIEKALKQIPAGMKILDAGAGECQFKKYCGHLDYVSQDVCEYQGGEGHSGLQTGEWNTSQIDIVSDIVDIPVPDSSFGAVMCTEVLEHVNDPVGCIKELNRILRPGGFMLLTSPFASLTHFAPYHFATGYNRYFYEHWLVNKFGYEMIDLDANGNFYEFLAQELRRLPSVAEDSIGNTEKADLTSNIESLLQHLQRFTDNDKTSSEILCFGWHVLARK